MLHTTEEWEEIKKKMTTQIVLEYILSDKVIKERLGKAIYEKLKNS